MHYTSEELVAAICAAGIVPGDVVSLQASLGRLGRPREAATYPEIANLVIDSFLNVLGPQGTLIIPTFTYSIGRGELFDVAQTPSAIGEFPEIFRRRPGVMRSRDPMLSSAGLGPKAEAILRNISNSCYGEGSTYQRLREVKAKICTLGISLYWATFRHHIEELAGIPFRFKKIFSGSILENGMVRRENWVYFAAPLVSNCEPVGLPLERKCREHGLVRVGRVGRGELMCIGAQEYFEFGVAQLRADPWLTAKGPPCDVGELVRLEDERVGARKIVTTLRSDATMPEIIGAICNLSRDVVSEGYDAALQALAGQIPMTIHEYSTGTECWTWIVPEKWTCREAYLETMDGKRLFSYRDNPLHVPSYSRPFRGIVRRQEIFDHLTVHPALREDSPYHSLFDTRDWGLCATQSLKDDLNDEQYHVVIDAAFSYGFLKVGESVVPGQIDECIVICSQLDRPAQASDSLSGCVVGVAVMREIAKRSNPRFSYRLLLLPGTIGLAAYLSRHEQLIRKMKGVIVLEAVGLDNPVVMRHSYDLSNPFDCCCLDVLLAREPGCHTEHLSRDSRSLFNVPGINLPIVSLSRAIAKACQAGVRPQNDYRRKLDAHGGIHPSRLDDTCRLVLSIIDSWENRNTMPVRFTCPG